MEQTVLVTGGAGYIGSHTALELARNGARVVIADNLSNSSERSVDAVRRLSGAPVDFIKMDLTDRSATAKLFETYEFDAVMHFAALKAVGESVAEPLAYYRNNLDSTLSVLEAMRDREVFDFVFSSSATVYGVPDSTRIPETAPTSATNPYGWTKLMIEQICADLAASDDRWRMVMLRYFNPVGADESGEIGEDPNGIPNNLVPFVMKVASGELPELSVFGGDYETPDGTGVRDYIHVVDLAAGHVAALQQLASGWRAYNLGTGHGTSVLEIIGEAERATGREIAYRIVDRRPGDVAASVADPSLAEAELSWRASRTVQQMLEDAWRWQSQLH